MYVCMYVCMYEMCLSLEHQNPSKTSEKMGYILIALQFRYTFYRPQTKRPRAGKIGLQYKISFFYSALRASVALPAPCASENMACRY